MPDQIQARFSEEYRRPIHWALLQQFLLGILCLLLLDGGAMARQCALVLVAFWVGATLIMVRRPISPTFTDKALIQLGFVPLLILSETDCDADAQILSELDTHSTKPRKLP